MIQPSLTFFSKFSLFKTKKCGFTIIETLISLSIAVLILGSLYNLLSQVWRGYRRGSYTAHSNKDIQRGFRFLKDKFSRANQSLSVYPWADPNGRNYVVFNPPGKNKVKLKANEISFDHWDINIAKTKFKNSSEVDISQYEAQLKSTVQVRYEPGNETRSGRIMYYETPPIDKEANPGMAVYEKIVMKDVTEFKFEKVFGESSKSVKIQVTLTNPDGLDKGLSVSGEMIMTFGQEVSTGG